VEGIRTGVFEEKFSFGRDRFGINVPLASESAAKLFVDGDNF
jgi:hypothetical protein